MRNRQDVPAWLDDSPRLLLIDGRRVPALSGKTFETRNPATGELLANVAWAAAEDIDATVAAARRALEGPWKRMKPFDRQQCLLKLADLVDANFNELAPSIPFCRRPWILSNCALDATGPIAVFSFGSPTFTCSRVALATATASSLRELGTSMRDGALQLCPLFIIITDTPATTLFAKSSSSSTMFGLLPPSSCVTRFTVGAAFFATSTPARVDPVKDTMSISGWLDNATPTPGPSP